MAVPPFIARPASEANEVARARLVVLFVAIGIAAALIAYAISPSVRHAVVRAAHGVGDIVSKDKPAHKKLAGHHTVTVPARAPAPAAP
jgi:hypothetical protein